MSGNFRTLLFGMVASLISALLIYFLYCDLGYALFRQTVNQAKPLWLTLFFINLPLEQVFRTLKWRENVMTSTMRLTSLRHGSRASLSASPN